MQELAQQCRHVGQRRRFPVRAHKDFLFGNLHARTTLTLISPNRRPLHKTCPTTGNTRIRLVSATLLPGRHFVFPPLLIHILHISRASITTHDSPSANIYTTTSKAFTHTSLHRLAAQTNLLHLHFHHNCTRTEVGKRVIAEGEESR